MATWEIEFWRIEVLGQLGKKIAILPSQQTDHFFLKAKTHKIHFRKNQKY
jgi:hypothetical protein